MADRSLDRPSTAGACITRSGYRLSTCNVCLVVVLCKRLASKEGWDKRAP
jgi:hypothetical protein